MRTLTRFGVATAATAIASATVLAGAGAAIAQDFPSTGSVAGDNFTMSSRSSLTAERTSGGVNVTYTNRTDRSLTCSGVSAPSDVISAFDAHVKKYGERSLAEGPLGELEEKIGGVESDPAMLARLFSLSPDGLVVPAVEDGVELTPGQNDPQVAPGKTLRWEVPAPTGYNAGAMVLCIDVNLDATGFGDLLSYAEYLSTNTSGGGGLLGSLDTGGSLGSLTGSLGS